MTSQNLPVLIVDIDDVLLDWTAGFDAFARDVGRYKGKNLKEETRRLWDAFSVANADVVVMMKYFAETRTFQELQYFNDAFLLCDAKHLFSKIIAVTSCGNTMSMIKNRSMNLELRFKDLFDAVIYLETFESKKNVLNDIKLNHPKDKIFMLDDDRGNIEAANAIGITGVLYESRLFKFDDMLSVNSMSKFLDIVKDSSTKTAVIGHTSDIGKEVVNAFVASGAGVVGLSRSTGFNIDEKIDVTGTNYSKFETIVLNAYSGNPFSQVRALYEIIESTSFNAKTLIIVLSSIKAYSKTSDTLARSKYAVSKAAVNNAANDLRNMGYFISTICPGCVDTGFNKAKTIPKMSTKEVADIVCETSRRFHETGLLINEITFERRR